MPASIYSVAGTKVYIGGVMTAKVTNFVAADFNIESWTSISWLENIGQFGDEASEIAFSPIDVNRTLKLKGVYNAGNMTIVAGRDYTDSGQGILLTASQAIYDYGFRVILNDMPSGGVAGSIRYFIGKVMMFREQYDTVNNVVRVNATIGINSNIVSVNAH
jgi:hypothetical protein